MSTVLYRKSSQEEQSRSVLASELKMSKSERNNSETRRLTVVWTQIPQLFVSTVYPYEKLLEMLPEKGIQDRLVTGDEKLQKTQFEFILRKW